MNKKQIIDKIVNDLPMSDMLGKMTKEEWYGWFEECWDKAINFTHCCTELNHDLKIGGKVVVTNRYVATISAFCADNDLIEIEDGCDYKQVDKEDVTKVV